MDRIVELEMGPTKAMDLLKLGNPRQTPQSEVAGPFPGGNYLHNKLGYGGGNLLKRRRWIDGCGIRLFSTGVPDRIDYDEMVVIELKTYRDKEEIPYHVERAIFQCCFYCWMLGFGRFNRFRILLYNCRSGNIDIVIEKRVDLFKFFKKFKKAIRLGIARMESGERTNQKKAKIPRGKYWLFRFFEPAAAVYDEFLPADRASPEEEEDGKVYYWLMKYFEKMLSS